MRTKHILAAALMGITASPVLAKAPPHEYGPPPDWSVYKAMAEEAVRANLRDPDSAKFRWVMGYAQGNSHNFLFPQKFGYGACGLVNARNSFGGYVGETAFYVMIDNGRVEGVNLDRQPGGIVEQECGADIARMKFLPLPADTDVAPKDASEDVAGLRLTTVPDGAYVSGVAATGAAAKAGIKPGMVIERLNGLSIKGLPKPAVDQLLASSSEKLTLTMVGGQSYSLAGAAR
jgi:hypothetical protein